MYRNIFPHIFSSTDSLRIFGGGGQDKIKSEFKVLIWNIYKARKRDWEQDFKSLSEGKDLILLQEAVAQTRFDVLFDMPKKMEWVMARSHTNFRTLCETGVKTGCNASSSSHSFLVSPDVEPFLKTPKMILITCYDMEGSEHPLMVVNMHAINFVSLKKYERQIMQMAQIILDHKGPIILAGDFNTWNVARYAVLRNVVEAAGLTELALTRKPRFQHMLKHLDHVFYKGMNPVSSEYKRIKSSDHDPISVHFRLSI